ncbi:MAG TPA: hypothetical protein PKY35_14600 [Candidatus Hydrogenedentes bacterium]|nr:hypothetical protein [Candidatus Hydrogenedentota bacterium]HOL78249.1 hypothetical protein [Candidatus Hydrogenedentota bacterium]HPO86389.1 hypothetical protein [Candidatus Hydrogenedentota bacterium]
MLRAPFASERIQMVDAVTGVKVIQLTSFPSPSAHFLYDWPSITPDNRRVVFFCQRYAGRGAPWDIFRCDADGLNLYQLTERQDREARFGYYGTPPAILSLDGKVIYVVWDTLLCQVDVETGDIEELLSLDRYCSEQCMPGRLHLAGKQRILYIDRPGPPYRPLRVDLSSGEVTELEFDGFLFGCIQEGPRLVIFKCKIEWTYGDDRQGVRRIINAGEEYGLWSVRDDGTDEQFICPSMFAHATVLGCTSKIQGCGRPPEHCIWLAEAGKPPERLVQGPYFWHSGASFDGEWIVSDTNWPDEGLQLIHVPTRRFRTLCYAHATQDHVHFGHPHPTVSHDGRLVLFRSDRTGVPQLYLVHITEEFRERVKSGELSGYDKRL